jgi:enoyl-CoA hydratase
MSSGLNTDVANGIAVIRLNQPATRNSLTLELINDLNTCVAEISNSQKINAIIFTGTDDVFASGADIRELSKLDVKAARNFALRGQQLTQRIADTQQLTIAAINGYCMGGGLDLALACDIRIALPNALFAHPGAKLGIITGWGGTQRLPRIIGRTRALELLLTAQVISAARAKEIGLVNFVAEDVLAYATEVAHSTVKRKSAES